MISIVGLEIHVAVVTKVMVAIPGLSAVISPKLFTVIIVSLSELQLPVSEEVSIPVSPTQRFDGPLIVAPPGLETVNISLSRKGYYVCG